MDRRVLPLALLLLTAAVSLAPAPAQAQDASSWSTPVAFDTGGDVADEIVMDAVGEKIGVAWQQDVGNDVGFAVKQDATSPWVTKTYDIDAGVDVNSIPESLIYMGSNRWLIAVNSGISNGCELWYSSDDGATWAEQNVIIAADCGTSPTQSQRLRWAGGDVVYYMFEDSGDLIVRKSNNLGASWAVSSIVNDNQGGLGTPTASIGTSGREDMVVYSDSVQVRFTSNIDRIHGVSSTNGGTSWSVPYTVNGGTTVDATLISCTPYSDFASGSPMVWNGPQRTPSADGLMTMFVHAARTSPTKQYGCADFSNEIPSSNPTNSYSDWPDVHGAADCNPDNQCLYAIADPTADIVEVYYDPPGGTTTLSLTGVAIQNPGGRYMLEMTDTVGYLVYVDGITGQFMERHASVFTPPAPDIVVSDDVAVTDLVGFAVDEAGAVAIARLDDGETVQVFDAGSLTAGALDGDPDCIGRHDGVAAYWTEQDSYLTYFECADDGDTDTLKIRTGTTLATPDPECEGTDSSIENSELDVPNELGELGSLSAVPFDFSVCGHGGLDDTTLSWAFSEVESGKVGVWTVNQANNNDDEFAVDTISFSGTGAVNQICVWQGPDDVDHLVAIAVGATSRAYLPVAGQVDSGTGVGVHDPIAEITNHYGFSGVFSQGAGVECAQELAIFQAYPSGDVGVVCAVPGHCKPGYAVGQAYFTPIHAGADTLRAVAISGNAIYAAYSDEANETFRVIYTENGTLRGEVPWPQATMGNFFDLEMDESGGSLWAAYTDHIYRWDISPITCVFNCTNNLPNPISTTSNTLGPGQVDLGGDSFLGNDEQDVEAALNVFADLGAIFGAMVLGVIPTWLLLLAALAAAAVIVMKLKGG